MGGRTRVGGFAAVARHQRRSVRRCSTGRDWQYRLTAERDTDRRRLSPDVSAVADPFTGVRFIYKQTEVIGGGTSQAAPIWAGLTVLMNQYLVANGGRPLGNANPLLYRRRRGREPPRLPRCANAEATRSTTPCPAMTWCPASGSPNIYNLARNILDAPEGGSPR